MGVWGSNTLAEATSIKCKSQCHTRKGTVRSGKKAEYVDFSVLNLVLSEGGARFQYLGLYEKSRRSKDSQYFERGKYLAFNLAGESAKVSQGGLAGLGKPQNLKREYTTTEQGFLWIKGSKLVYPKEPSTSTHISKLESLTVPAVLGSTYSSASNTKLLAGRKNPISLKCTAYVVNHLITWTPIQMKTGTRYGKRKLCSELS